MCFLRGLHNYQLRISNDDFASLGMSIKIAVWRVNLPMRKRSAYSVCALFARDRQKVKSAHVT
jgi:hypothetical protein